MSPFPLPVVKIREVSSAMSLKHLPAVLAWSLYCPKRVVPSSGNLEDSIFRSQQGMHCNTTQSTTVKDWIRVLRYTTLLFICLRGGGLPGAATYVTPSLNHAGCVISTSGVISFFFFSYLELMWGVFFHCLRKFSFLIVSALLFKDVQPVLGGLEYLG